MISDNYAKIWIGPKTINNFSYPAYKYIIRPVYAWRLFSWQFLIHYSSNINEVGFLTLLYKGQSISNTSYFFSPLLFK